MIDTNVFLELQMLKRGQRMDAVEIQNIVIIFTTKCNDSFMARVFKFDVNIS